MKLPVLLGNLNISLTVLLYFLMKLVFVLPHLSQLLFSSFSVMYTSEPYLKIGVTYVIHA